MTRAKINQEEDKERKKNLRKLTSPSQYSASNGNTGAIKCKHRVRELYNNGHKTIVCMCTRSCAQLNLRPLSVYKSR